MRADEPLGVGGDLDSLLAEEQQLLEAAGGLGGEDDRHRARLAEIPVDDLAADRLEGAALLAVVPLRLRAFVTASPCFDQVGERGPRPRLHDRGRAGCDVGDGGRVLVRVRNSGHLESPLFEPAARLPSQVSPFSRFSG